MINTIETPNGKYEAIQYDGANGEEIKAFVPQGRYEKLGTIDAIATPEPDKVTLTILLKSDWIIKDNIDELSLIKNSDFINKFSDYAKY